jgi:signal transduction histidine kinase/CheY-like chemotaxis protein
LNELVLVVDDQEETREFVVNQVLAPNGYRFMRTAGGPREVEQALEAHPDLIIFSLENAAGALDTLRGRETQVPLLFSTSQGLGDAALQSHALQDTEEIVPALDAGRMLAAIERMLRQARLRRERDLFYQQVQHEKRMQKLLYTIGQSIDALSDHQQALARLVEAAVYMASADVGSLLLQDTEAGQVRVHVHLDKRQNGNAAPAENQEPALTSPQRARTVDEYARDRVVLKVIESGEPLLLSTQDAAAVRSQLGPLGESPLASALLYVPIKVRGATIGVLRMARLAPHAEAFTSEQVYRLSILANYAANVIEKARLHERIQNEIERAAICQIGASFGSTLRMDAILDMVMQVAVQILDAERGYIALLDEESGTYVPRATYALSPEQIRQPEFSASREVVYHVIHDKAPCLTHVDLAPSDEKEAGARRVALCVPIVGPAGVTGAIYVDHCDHDQHFDQYQQDLLTALAVNASAAVENARLFNQVEVERRKLEAVIRGTDQPVIVTDVGGTVMLMNRAAHRAFSTRQARATGMLLPQVSDHPVLASIFEQARLSGRIQHSEISPNQEQTFNITVTPIPEVGLITVMQDVTEFKRLSQMKSEFVATVSHDLRSPLSTVLSLLNVVRQAGPLTEKQEDFVSGAEQEVTRLLELTHDLLDLGRLEADMDLEMQQCDLKAVIVRSLENCKTQLVQGRFRLEITLPDEPALVHGDAGRLRQVIDNLLSNAIKYTLPGGRIAVYLGREGQEVVLRVADSGIGIAPEDQPHVFDRFFRVRNDETEGIEGTGLGLAIVKSIVERHRGRIWLESEAGEGSTFGVALPAAGS